MQGVPSWTQWNQGVDPQTGNVLQHSNMNIKKEVQDNLEENNEDSLNSFENDLVEEGGWPNFDSYNDNDQEYYGFDGEGFGAEDEEYGNVDDKPRSSGKIKRKRKGKKRSSASDLSKKVCSHSKTALL